MALQLPFREQLNEWARQENLQTHLFLGLGTSGEFNVTEMVTYAKAKQRENPNQRFFILCIDTVYGEIEQRRRSLEPILNADLGYQQQEGGDFTLARNPAGNLVYLWGLRLLSAYGLEENPNFFTLYEAARNHQEGPYAYGTRCRLRTLAMRNFYTPLLDLFQNPLFTSLYVYNRGFTNMTLPGYRRLYRQEENQPFPELKYRGPRFRNDWRIERADDFSSARITYNLYFEDYCELLYCLHQAGKPVRLLEKEGDHLVDYPLLQRAVEPAPLVQANAQQEQPAQPMVVNGGKRKKSKSRRRSQSRRRRTGKSLGRK